MWAHRLRAPGRFEAVDVAAPRPDDLADGDVLLRTVAGGICGSDTPKFRGHKGVTFGPGPAGFPMHEVVGDVVASRHAQVTVGSRVVGWARASNAIAEYVVTAGDEVQEFDASLDAPTAVLIQSVACVLYAADQLPLDGARVAILGLGPIGLLFAHAARAGGAASVTGVDPVERRCPASSFGLDRVVCASSSAWAGSLADAHESDERRPDLVIEAVGHQVSTLQHAVAAVANGGRILYFGIPDDDVYPLDMERMMRKNLTLTAGITRRRREMLARANTYLIAHPDLPPALVSHVFPVERIQEAFDTATTPSPSRQKVLVTMP